MARRRIVISSVQPELEEEARQRVEAARIQPEREKAIAEERAQRQRLSSEANRWAQSIRIRDSVAPIRPSAAGRLNTSAELNEWTEWAVRRGGGWIHRPYLLQNRWCWIETDRSEPRAERGERKHQVCCANLACAPANLGDAARSMAGRIAIGASSVVGSGRAGRLWTEPSPRRMAAHSLAEIRTSQPSPTTVTKLGVAPARAGMDQDDGGRIESISRAARTPDSVAPSIVKIVEVCSPAKWMRPSTVATWGKRAVISPGP